MVTWLADTSTSTHLGPSYFFPLPFYPSHQRTWKFAFFCLRKQEKSRLAVKSTPSMWLKSRAHFWKVSWLEFHVNAFPCQGLSTQDTIRRCQFIHDKQSPRDCSGRLILVHVGQVNSSEWVLPPGVNFDRLGIRRGGNLQRLDEGDKA